MEDEILSILDNTFSFSPYYSFIPLNHPYSYLIDCRLNVFKGESKKWAIAGEILGYNPRAGCVELNIYYYGNCLINLTEYNNQFSNYYSVYPIEENSFFESIDELYLNADAKFWLVRGSEVLLSTESRDYAENNILLSDLQGGQISIEEAARLVVVDYHELFRATDDELYKSIPKDLKKTLVLDEWHHKDYNIIKEPSISEGQLKSMFNSVGVRGMDFEAFKKLQYAQTSRNDWHNKSQWDKNRPSVYETWQQIAKVISTGDASFFKPTLKPNTHWTNWPESGSL